MKRHNLYDVAHGRQPVDYAKFESEAWERDYKRGLRIAHGLLLAAALACIGAIVVAACVFMTPAAKASTITDYPFRFDSLQFYNVNRDLALMDWTGSNIDFTAQSGTQAAGILSLVGNGIPWPAQPLSGSIASNGVFSLQTSIVGVPILFSGAFDPNFMGARGRIDGLGRSDLTGFYTLTQVELPAALGLFLMSLGAIGLFARRR